MFWQTLKQQYTNGTPIIGLAPMDGVTDAAFRFITAKYGKPDLLFTEFTNVEGICHGNIKGLYAFIYSEIERPIIGQLFGTDPNSFYKSALLLCAMGFDGIDINMGCPAKKVSEKGAGAGLIRTPELAKQIVLACKQASQDYFNGKNPEDTDLPTPIIDFIKRINPNRHTNPRTQIPISIKTRIGIDKNIIETWIKHLLEVNPAAITVHGRTLKQMYTGQADWDAIATAAHIIRQTETLILGNGDLQTLDQAKQQIQQANTHGALIGRATFGNPWLFNPPNQPDFNQNFQVLLEHCEQYTNLLPELHFSPMKKHLGWYCKGFIGAKTLRQQLMTCESPPQVKTTLTNFTHPQQS